MSVRIAAAYLILSSFIGCTKNESSKAEVQRIAFGSCAYQTAPSGIYNYIVGKKPDLYLALGDNIYADDGPEVRDFEKHINFMYSLLESNGNFRDLANNMPILATWDDHDFGLNNSGAEFDKKDISKEAFLEFLTYPKMIRDAQERAYTIPPITGMTNIAFRS